MENEQAIHAGRDARQVIDALRRLRDVTEMTSPAGQVLVYAGHYPNGLFVLLSGVVELRGETLPEPLRRSAEQAPLVVPPVDELEIPSVRSATTATESRILFVPRTLVHGSADVITLLSCRGLQYQSLQKEASNPNPTRSE